MKSSFFNLPVLAISGLILFAGAWTLSPASAQVAVQVSENWNNFLDQANAQASDHAKLKDCVTEGKE